MNNILSEKEYQKYILDKLDNNGYVIRQSIDFDRLFAVDRGMLMKFLDDTQPKTMTALRKVYKDNTEETIINLINSKEVVDRGSRLDVLKHGVDISNMHLDLMYTKPATDFNPEATKLYDKNIFSVAEEVWASDEERIDLVIFLNGLAIMAFELKCNAAGQSYQDAIYQFRTQRNPKSRLFRWKAGVLVSFAMDLEQVFMTTKLENASTFFLPFNMGKGEGIYAGAGNPLLKDEYSVHYMWDNILQKDSLIEIISKFMFIEYKEKKDPDTGKTTKKETVIFPRYHQLDVVRKLLASVVENGTSQNYLLQHSAGSGKTNEIAWLAHRLASLHDENNNIIFDNIVICTDRVVVDRQLQQAVMGIEHKSGLIRVMDDTCTSADLADALKGNTKIIGTTIQKFPYILNSVSNLNKKNFAVIIDEAHSSTAGKNMAAVTKSLGSGEQNDDATDIQDVILGEIQKTGKQKNVAMFAFTATPKATTIESFGTLNTKGQKEAFHIYSIKQAVEEGFILDVLQNYITYDTYFKINKEIKEDPEMKTASAKSQIARFVKLDDTNIAQRVEVIIEHFRTTVLDQLDGKAKAMVVTSSRAEAVKYRQAFERYIERKEYKNIHALVAFSGKVSLDGNDYTESGMNGFPEKDLPAHFDKDDYQVLLVADKYQTGFDQAKLCAMYVLKKLSGVSAVQTLSRLNRIYPPYEKKTFVLDFVNSYEDIEDAFSKYYTTTILSNSVNPNTIYDIESKLDGYYFLDPSDIEEFNKLLYAYTMTDAEKKKLTYYLQKAKNSIVSKNTKDKQKEIIKTIRHFVRFYDFLIQVSCFEDLELHKKYNFLSYLQSYIKIESEGPGYNLKGKIKATGFVQSKTGEHNKEPHYSNPVVNLPVTDQISLTPDKIEKLSQIIAEINSKTGKTYDNDFAVKSMLQIKDIMSKSDYLKTSAKNNTEKDFEFAYYDNLDDALIKGLAQNEDFFTLLLNNDSLKKEVMGIFTEEIYKLLRDE
ncbi:MAG: type I restriction endonuclease subunit R [Clostridiales bacterium]|nr:type I restriction endonuclease subunit R [Candidatus Crickella equi]